MKNLMNQYIEFSIKKIRKYIKMIFRTQYDDDIVKGYLKTYLNARYYNIDAQGVSARVFYRRIIGALDKKEKILLEKYKNKDPKLISNVKRVFFYILFFDNVRKVENFKNIKSIREVISELITVCEEEFGMKVAPNLEENLYQEVTNDMLQKDIYLDNLESSNFYINFEKHKTLSDVYYTKLDYHIKLPMQYSEAAINKVYNDGLIGEDKLEIEYTLLSVVCVRDIQDSNFKDRYIAEFASSLFKKKQKLKSLLSLIDNQALQDKILINITYKDLIKNRESVLEYIREGYNFVITLDDYVKNMEEVRKLKMFKIVLVPKNIKMHDEIMKNKSVLNNVVEE